MVLVLTMGLLIHALIIFIVQKQRLWKGYLIACRFLVASILMGFLLHHMTSWCVRLRIGVRSAIVRAIFAKGTTAKAKVGAILSLISRDSSILVQYLWSGPI